VKEVLDHQLEEQFSKNLSSKRPAMCSLAIEDILYIEEGRLNYAPFLALP
jgi:hypothetical protein